MQYIDIQMLLYIVFLVLCAKTTVRKQLLSKYIYLHNSLKEWVYQGTYTKYGFIAVYVPAFSMALDRITRAAYIAKETMRASLIIIGFSMHTPWGPHK